MENYNRIYNEIYREAVPGFVGSTGYAKRANNKLNKASTKVNAKYATVLKTLEAACGELAMEIVNLQKKWTLKGALLRKNAKKGANNTPANQMSSEDLQSLAPTNESNENLVSRFLEDVKVNEQLNTLLKSFGMTNIKDPKPIATYLFNMAKNPKTTDTFIKFMTQYQSLFGKKTLASKRVVTAYSKLKGYLQSQQLQNNIVGNNSNNAQRNTLNQLAQQLPNLQTRGGANSNMGNLLQQNQATQMNGR